MAFGIRTEDKKTYCKKCSQELKMIVPEQIFNFCQYCGSPLNLLSFNLVKEKEKLIKLKTINEVQKVITDKNDLENLLILIDEISKK